MPRQPDPRVITVRMPPELHSQLRKLAFARETSMNLLCTSMIATAVQCWRDEQEHQQAGTETEKGAA